MTFEQWAESFNIFAKYQPDDKNSYVDVGYKEIHAGPRDTSIISTEDRARLEELGWSDESYGIFTQNVWW